MDIMTNLLKESKIMILNETTERNEKNNWIKLRLLGDNFKIIQFEGYTVKDNRVTGLFDRRLFTEVDFDTLSEGDVSKIVQSEENMLSSKLYFAELLNVHYRYVFYSYESEKIYVYRFEGNTPKFKKKFNDFCSFIHETKKLRDLKMLSPLQEDNMPQIDHIFRGRCGYAWMGNLDGLFLSDNDGIPKALVEFQTTSKASVKDHCNNTWFLPRNGRKGDEQRWKACDIIAQQSGLPLIIIVWSPNEVNGDIQYKAVKEVIYSDDMEKRKAGLVYSTKEVLNYDQLLKKLDELINNKVKS